MLSVGGQFGELLAEAVLVTTIIALWGYWSGWPSKDLFVYATGALFISTAVRWRFGPAGKTPSALKPLAQEGDGSFTKESELQPIGAAQAKLLEHLAVLDLHPIILQILQNAMRRGKWYDSWEDLQTYFSTDSFDTIVEEVRELGLDVNQAKSFVRRMQREFERSSTSKVRDMPAEQPTHIAHFG